MKLFIVISLSVFLIAGAVVFALASFADKTTIAFVAGGLLVCLSIIPAILFVGGSVRGAGTVRAIEPVRRRYAVGEVIDGDFRVIE